MRRKTEYGEELARVRRMYGNISATRLAEILEISPSYLSTIESGLRSIPADLTQKISHRLKLTAASASSLRAAETVVRGFFEIRVHENQQREVAALMEEVFHKLKPDELKKIRALIEPYWYSDDPIVLPVYGITVHLGGGGGRVTSDLEKCPEYDAIESMILAHAVAGIDIETPAYLEGIETAIDAINNHADSVDDVGQTDYEAFYRALIKVRQTTADDEGRWGDALDWGRWGDEIDRLITKFGLPRNNEESS